MDSKRLTGHMAIVSEQIDDNARLLDASEIGAILASARRSKDMSLQELSDALRIPKNYLKSLENSDFENLPGIAYVPGYIRSYCKATDIDSSALIAAYFSSVDDKDVLPVYDVPGQALVPKFSKSSVAMVAVIIAIIGYAGWFVVLRQAPDQIVSEPLQSEQMFQIVDATNTDAQNLSNLNNEQPTEIAQSNLQVPTSFDEDNSEEVIAGSDFENNGNNLTEIVEAESPSMIPTETENWEARVASLSNNSSSEKTTQVADIKTSISAVPKPQSSNPSSAIAKEVELSDTLTIRATAASWIEMVNADGDVITSKLLRTGESIAANLEDQLYLTTGNAGGLMFEMVDKPAFRVGKTGEIVRDLPLRADSIFSRKFD